MKKYRVNVNGYAYEVEIEEVREGSAGGYFSPAAAPAVVQSAPSAPMPQSAQPTQPATGAQGSVTGATINAPMQGKILGVKVAAGENVVPGQVVAILEAMKMENEIVASETGRVASVSVSPGQSVDAGDVLITLG